MTTFCACEECGAAIQMGNGEPVCWRCALHVFIDSPWLTSDRFFGRGEAGERFARRVERYTGLYPQRDAGVPINWDRV